MTTPLTTAALFDQVHAIDRDLWRNDVEIDRRNRAASYLVKRLTSE